MYFRNSNHSRYAPPFRRNERQFDSAFQSLYLYVLLVVCAHAVVSRVYVPSSIDLLLILVAPLCPPPYPPPRRIYMACAIRARRQDPRQDPLEENLPKEVQRKTLNNDGPYSLYPSSLLCVGYKNDFDRSSHVTCSGRSATR